MANSLLEQRVALERKLESITDSDIRGAVEAQLTSIKKRISAKAGRTVVLGDGVEARIGDIVYSVWNVPNVRINYDSRTKTYTENVTEGSIRQNKINSVNPAGTEISFVTKYNSRTDFKKSTYYFSTKQTATDAGNNKAKNDLETLKLNLVELTARYDATQKLIASNPEYKVVEL